MRTRRMQGRGLNCDKPCTCLEKEIVHGLSIVYSTVSMDAIPYEICRSVGSICTGASWISLVS